MWVGEQDAISSFPTKRPNHRHKMLQAQLWLQNRLNNKGIGFCEEDKDGLTIIMACRSAISWTPDLHKMITVPVASRPLLPALPAIWMYSPCSADPDREKPIKMLQFIRRRRKMRELQTWQQIPEAGAVVFPDAIKHHGPGWHVDAHGKCLRGKQHLRTEMSWKGITANKATPFFEFKHKQPLTFTRPREKSISITSFRIGRIPLWWTAIPLFSRSRISKICTRTSINFSIYSIYSY